MNDIKIRKNINKETYDWSFTPVDVEDITGLERIKNNVIHAVLLRYQELQQVFYQDAGCAAWDYIISKDSSINRTIISEMIRTAANRVENVQDAQVNFKWVDYYTFNAAMTLITDYGEAEINEF